MNDHDVRIKWVGTLPFALCETCEWEGPTRDHEREAADDLRNHQRETSSPDA
jgi:hypothetical protein